MDDSKGHPTDEKAIEERKRKEKNQKATEVLGVKKDDE